MKKIRIFIFVISVFSSLYSKAQDLSMDYYSYLYNWYNINPAFCAKGDKMSAILNVRQRTVLSANNSMFGMKGLLGESQGVGVRVLSDTRGAFQVLKTDATYGYNLKIDEDQSLYLGLSAGLTNKSFNVSKVKNYDQLDGTDPALESSNLRANLFTAGAGMIYDYKDLELSVCSPQLVEGSQKASTNLLFLANYRFYLKNDIMIMPEMFFFNLPVVKNYGGLQVKGEYKKMVWAQMGYQTNSNFNLGAGFSLGIFGFGYGYMTANNLMKSQTTGTHEVLLTIRIANKKSGDVVAGSSIVPASNEKNPSVYSNRLNSILDKLESLSKTDKKYTKSELRQQLDVIRTELKEISNSNFSTEDPDTLEKKIILIEEQIKLIEERIKQL